MRVLFIILFLILNVTAFCQQFEYKGNILNKITKTPIPYATIQVSGSGNGAMSDENGEFLINLDSTLMGKTIQINAIGYEKKDFLIITELIKSNINIEVSPSPVLLNEINISTSVSKYVKGCKSKSAKGKIIGNIGYQYALFIHNDKIKDGYFKSISFFIEKLGFPQAPFRIRIYKTKDDSLTPYEELFTEPLIVNANKGNKWFKVDVLKYNIPFPKNGCFVAIEFIHTNKNYYFEYQYGDSLRQAYGATFGLSTEIKECLFWTKSPKSAWGKHSSIENGKIFINPMINAEINLYD